MQKIGLIGCPIEHSLSPAVFREKYGEDNPLFSYDLIQCDDFDEAISVFKKEYHAINVTAPFKEKAYGIADVLDDNSKIAAALNLLVKGDDGLIRGYNTDVTAVRTILSRIVKEAGIGHPRVLVAGMGGAGKAAASAALMSGAQVILCNRSLDRAAAFEEHLKSIGFCPSDSFTFPMAKFGLNRFDEAVKVADVVIYALPRISPAESPDDAAQIAQSGITLGLLKSDLKGKWVVEANYRDPLFSEKMGEEDGFRYFSGIGWLRLQAEETFRIVMG